LSVEDAHVLDHGRHAYAFASGAAHKGVIHVDIDDNW
jgi:hypothetical protein